MNVQPGIPKGCIALLPGGGPQYEMGSLRAVFKADDQATG
jgi:hypothetical protein